MAECDAVDGEIAALKAAYEQFFLGLEKRPPTDKHQALGRRIQKLRNMWIRQTAAKFRVQSVTQKWSTYERLWSKTMQAIENGTYVRDLARLKRKQNAAGAPKKKEKRDALDDLEIDEAFEELSGGNLDEAIAQASAAAEASVANRRPAVQPAEPAVAPAIPPLVAPPVASVEPPQSRPAAAAATTFAPKIAPVAPSIPPVTPAIAPVVPPVPAARAAPAPGAVARPPSSPPAARAPANHNPTLRPASVPSSSAAARSGPYAPPTVAGASQLSDDKLRAVYDAFIKAKRRCNEDTSSMTFEQVASSLRRQVPELMKQHNAKAVEFKVVIKDGKAVLRAVPKDG
ncbi:MAG: hypothetical protein IRZ16_01925 [Myxococcaceae bacterium]|nr:hypothetical protein [Myxococcaceae bacterium]